MYGREAVINPGLREFHKTIRNDWIYGQASCFVASRGNAGAEGSGQSSRT